MPIARRAFLARLLAFAAPVLSPRRAATPAGVAATPRAALLGGHRSTGQATNGRRSNALPFVVAA